MLSSLIVQGAGYKLPIDADGFLYLSTGNGDFNADPSNFNANGFPIDGEKLRNAGLPVGLPPFRIAVLLIIYAHCLVPPHSCALGLQATTQTPCSSEFACGSFRPSRARRAPSLCCTSTLCRVADYIFAPFIFSPLPACALVQAQPQRRNHPYLWLP